MVELARLMQRLGAESALNLDGGGSTTMAGLEPRRQDLRVLNSPSDGSQRPIPDGIAVLVDRLACPASPAPSSSRSATPRCPDLLGPDCRLLFVGINPGLWTAATQTHFAHPVNRFYPALPAAGILARARSTPPPG